MRKAYRKNRQQEARLSFLIFIMLVPETRTVGIFSPVPQNEGHRPVHEPG